MSPAQRWWHVSVVAMMTGSSALASDVVGEARASILSIESPAGAGTSGAAAFIVDQEGHAVTLARFVGNARSITVRPLDGGQPVDADVVLVSSQKDDLAVIRIRWEDAAPARPLPIFASGVLPLVHEGYVLRLDAGAVKPSRAKVTAADRFGAWRERAASVSEYGSESTWLEIAGVPPANSTPGTPVLSTAGAVLGVVGAGWKPAVPGVMAIEAEHVRRLLKDAGIAPGKDAAPAPEPARPSAAPAPRSGVQPLIMASTRFERDARCPGCSGTGKTKQQVRLPDKIGNQRGAIKTRTPQSRDAVLACRTCGGEKVGPAGTVSRVAVDFVKALGSADPSDPEWTRAEGRATEALKNVVALGLGNLRERVNSPIIERLAKAGTAPEAGEAMFLVGTLIADHGEDGGARHLRVNVSGTTFVVVSDARIIDAQVGETVFAGGVFLKRELDGANRTGYLERGFVVTNRN